MVIDIGGEATSISIVHDDDDNVAGNNKSEQKNNNNNNNNNNDDNNNEEDDQKILYHTRLDGFGGEVIIQTIMNYLCKIFYNGTNIHELTDASSKQRLYDSSIAAVQDISGSKHGRTEINIPYLSMNEQMQPRDLNVS